MKKIVIFSFIFLFCCVKPGFDFDLEKLQSGKPKCKLKVERKRNPTVKQKHKVQKGIKKYKNLRVVIPKKGLFANRCSGDFPPLSM